MENYFWTSGPTWMRLPVADWPIREQRFFDESGEEVDSIKCLVSTEETETHPLYDMVMRLSSYTTILRVTVWVLRFVKILTVKSFITLSDMNRAEVALVRIVQGKYFKSDIKLLNLGKEISNRLRKLNPFLQNGILMVGGRLENAPLTFVARHPIILPVYLQSLNDKLAQSISDKGTIITLFLNADKARTTKDNTSLKCEVAKSENNPENSAGSLKRPRGEYSFRNCPSKNIMAKNETLQNQQNAETSWKTVNYNRKKKTKSSELVGTHTSSTSSSIHGIPKVSVLHVSTLSESLSSTKSSGSCL
ncbi:hypothetical protein JTB14_023207 [Gonioctena quinquepunctata]|nr:hypothetical protein JTB14_023207 [Gonioctena quinquepunctata]